MNRQKLLAESIRHSRDLLLRYFKGFDDTNHVQPAPSLPNHFAWTLGHLSLTLHRVAEKVDGRPLPDADFAAAGGGTQRFCTESVCFGSKPIADAMAYPPTERCVAIFASAIDRCAAAFESATDEQLDAEVPWGSAKVPAWQAAVRMVFHNGTHCGQLADLRRALGMQRVLG